jgi:hypothetical protein
MNRNEELQAAHDAYNAATNAADRKKAHAAFRAVWAAGEAELARIDEEYPQ